MEYKPGMKIPSERDLSRDLGLSRMTVKNAINKLVDEGILYRIHGSGTFVSNYTNRGRMIIGSETPDAFNLNMSSIGRNASSIVISFKVLYDSKEFRDIFPGRNDFYELVRLRQANNMPMSIEYCYFPFRLFIDANRYDFSKVSLYDYMNHNGLLPVTFNKTLEIIIDNHINQILELKKNTPLFFFIFLGKSASGLVVEYTRSYTALNNIEFKYLLDIE